MFIEALWWKVLGALWGWSGATVNRRRGPTSDWILFYFFLVVVVCYQCRLRAKNSHGGEEGKTENCACFFHSSLLCLTELD